MSDGSSDGLAKPTDPALPVRARARRHESRTVAGIASQQAALELAEELRAQGLRPSTITSMLMARGIGEKRANVLQAVVKLRWQERERLEGSEQRITLLREMGMAAFAAAGDRKVCVCIGKDAETGEKIYEVVPQPDTRGQAALLSVLLELEGKAAPKANTETPEAAAKLVQDAMAQQYGAQAVMDAEGEDG